MSTSLMFLFLLMKGFENEKITSQQVQIQAVVLCDSISDSLQKRSGGPDARGYPPVNHALLPSCDWVQKQGINSERKAQADVLN